MHNFTAIGLPAFTLTFHPTEKLFFKSSLFLVLFCWLLPFSTLSAQAQLSFKEPSTSSPTAASFQKFIDIPVSLHTGVPSIGIPIHTVTEGSLSTSISLNYNSSGIKVDEMAGWVGLGWALNAQGMISRSVQGIKDETGFLANSGIPSQLNQTPCTYDPNCDYSAYCQNICPPILSAIIAGTKDAEPDIFSFNFGGFSGKFVFGADQQIHFLSAQDIKITHNYENDFDKWLAVTPDGTKYYFGNTFNRNATEYSTGDGASNFATQSTSWYLTRIESSDGIYWIDFSYTAEDYNYFTRTGHSITVTSNGPSESKPTVSQTFVYAKRLTSIQTSTNKTTINFVTPVTKRQDISQVGTSASGSYNLSEINITTGGICKKFVLNQDYFQGLTTPIYNVFGQTENDADTKRLRLNSIQEMTCDGLLTTPAYVFTYNTTALPRRLSLARDMQGYYNGYDTNQGLLPLNMQTGSDYNNLPLNPSVTGDRTIVESSMKAGILEKVLYPTGGYSEFSYEAHRLTPTSTALYGGLRIKTIAFKENSTSSLLVKNYSYTQGVYFGENGNYFRVNAKELSDPAYTFPVPGGGTQAGCWVNTSTQYSSSSPKAFQGYHFGYTDISVLNLDGSKTETKYVFDDYFSASSFYYPYVPKLGVQDNVIQTQEVSKNNLGQTVKTVNYSYNTPVQGSVSAKKIVTATSASTSYCGVRYIISNYNVQYKQKRLLYKEEITDGVSVRTDYKYNTSNLHTQPIEITTANSDGKKNVIKTYYAHDIDNSHPNFSIKQTFLNKNMVGVPLQVEISTEGVSGVVGSVVEYSNFGTTTKFYPYKYYSIHKDNTRDVEAEITYDGRGLPYSLKKKNFTPVTYFGFDGYDRLITKNTYGSANTISSSFTYVGVSDLVASMTDENGLVKKFYYDGFQRLEKIEDRMNSNGDDVQATTLYKYHYKGQATDFAGDINYNFVSTKSSFKGVTTDLITKQYMDGLGRPFEVVKEGYTPISSLHQKNYVSYDALGRQNKTYLPFEGSALGVELPPASTSTLTEFELSPLSRPIKQTNVDNSIVTTSYGTNVASEVRLIPINAGGGASTPTTSYYAANSLFKTIVTDENGKQTSIFKDKLGRVILTRKTLSGQNVDTYNVYDDYGQLVAVLPPASIDASGNINDALTFQYKYDSQNRLMEKKVPGAAVQKFYYDSRDLMVLTQDGNMRTEAKYLATLYDDLGRVVKTGFAYVSPTQGQNFNLVDAHISDKLTETQYYPNKSWVKHQGAKVLKAAGVSTPTNFVWSYIERRVGAEYTGNPIWTGKQHLMYPYVAQRPIDDNDSYGVDWSVSAYNGMQQPDYSIRYLFAGTSANEVRTRQDFVYDNGRRMTHSNYAYTLNAGGLPSSATFTLSNMVYNFKDQLTEKNIGLNGSNALQSIDYWYNLRGWLTAINNVNTYTTFNPIYTPGSTGSGAVQNLAIMPLVNKAINNAVIPFKQEEIDDIPPPVTDNNTDLFSQNIYYNGADSRFQAASQGNGNIQAVTWQVAGRTAQGYGFTYDDLDRLTNAKYFDLTNSGTTTNFSTDYKFNESQAYDLRGNITSLQRNGLNTGTWTSNGYTAATYGMIDNLAYTYNAQNQLLIVKDASFLDRGFKSVNNPNSTQYAYDYNGNLKSDLNKGITNITYNYLNLPQVITFTGGRSILFVYDAGGTKLRKITNNNGIIVIRDYVNGVEYKNNVLDRIAHTEGAVVCNDVGGYQHEFVLRDHLGNTRVTFTDGKNLGDGYWDWNTYSYVNPNANNLSYNDGVITSADIKQINHYYPFGLNMEGDWNGAAGSNKYQYNGKEWNDDFGLGWNHHDWRFYDVAIGRFVTVDRLPEEEDQEQLTPYQFAYDNPIRYDDPDGQCPTCVVGGLVGGFVEFGGQVLTNLSEGKSVKESLTDIDIADVGFAIVEGALTSGGSVVRRAAVKTAITVGAEIAENVLDVKINDGKLDVKVNKSLISVAKNTAIGLAAGKIGDKLPTPKIGPKIKQLNPPTPKQAVKQARAQGQKVTREKRLNIENKAKVAQKNAKEIKDAWNKLPGNTAAEAAGEKTKRKTD